MVETLRKEIDWLQTCIRACLQKKDPPGKHPPEPPYIDPFKAEGYAAFVTENNLDANERLLLVLSLCVHLDPNLLNVFTGDEEIYRCAKLVRSVNGTTLIPTGETFLFIASENDLEKRIACYSLFNTDHVFYKKSAIELGETQKGESLYGGTLSLSSSYRDFFIYGKFNKPRFSNDFPAHPVYSALDWDDMILMSKTKESLEEVQAFLEYYTVLKTDNKLKRHVRPGCRILFYGEPGTGKTLAAGLLGKRLNKEVFRVDISAITSKYVGDSVKRFDALFNTAESKGWIIFIDEGDSLLGQRKSTDNGSNTSHYANQDVAFLLQRIENYDGIIIVATNLKNNLDQAFMRRFQNVVKFYAPDEAAQLRLWKENAPISCPIAAEVDLQKLVRQHPLTPASIMNVIMRSTILCLKNKKTEIDNSTLQMCVKDEEIKYLGRQLIPA